MKREKTAEFSVIKQQELQTHRAGLVTPTRESHLEKKHRDGPEYQREVWGYVLFVLLF
jgi:hypothetical protein